MDLFDDQNDEFELDEKKQINLDVNDIITKLETNSSSGSSEEECIVKYPLNDSISIFKRKISENKKNLKQEITPARLIQIEAKQKVSEILIKNLSEKRKIEKGDDKEILKKIKKNKISLKFENLSESKIIKKSKPSKPLKKNVEQVKINGSGRVRIPDDPAIIIVKKETNLELTKSKPSKTLSKSSKTTKNFEKLTNVENLKSSTSSEINRKNKPSKVLIKTSKIEKSEKLEKSQKLSKNSTNNEKKSDISKKLVPNSKKVTSPEKENSTKKLVKPKKSLFKMYQKFSLDDKRLEKMKTQLNVHVQNLKPFLTNKNFFDGILMKSLQKRMGDLVDENFNKKICEPENKSKNSKDDHHSKNTSNVSPPEIVVCDLNFTEQNDKKPINLPLKSILVTSTTQKKTQNYKKVTFCNSIFIKTIEYVESEHSESEFDDDDDSNDEDYKG